MLTLFLIPERFDLDDTSFTRGPFTNLINKFHDIHDEKVQLWQQNLCTHATPVELESNTWAVEIIQKSMTDGLKTVVFDDLRT